MMEAHTIDSLRFLAAAFAYPRQSRLDAASILASNLRLESSLSHPCQEILEAQYHRLFSGQRQCSPHETEYGPGRSVRKAVELADIAGFYRAFRLAIDQEDPEVVDHIALEMDFLAHVAFKERYAALQGWQDQAEICSLAYLKFWQDHMAKWVCGFFDSVVESAPEGSFYQQAARFGRELCGQELARLGLAPGGLTQDNREVTTDECLGCTAPSEETITNGL